MYNRSIKINNRRRNVLESICDIERCLMDNDIVPHDFIVHLKNSIDLFESVVDSRETNAELLSFRKKYNGFRSLENASLNEAHGFFNPFEFLVDVDDEVKLPHNKKRIDNNYKGVRIMKVSPWNSDIDGKVAYSNGIVRACQYFHKGDIIERSPVKIIYNDDLYSKRIRDIAFTINAERGIYGIPFGYAAWYRDSVSASKDGNVDYCCDVINDEEGFIEIYAIKNIKKGEEIIIKSDKLDYENAYKKSSTDNEIEVIKNFKFH